MSAESEPTLSEVPAAGLDDETAIRLLREGQLEVAGRLIEATNMTLYCSVRLGGLSAACVYKPVRGERPLWDFPDGTLAAREVAAYEVSAATGWRIVPPTVYRDGPFGPGMCQLWIDADSETDLMVLIRSRQPSLRRMAVFDAIVNNADRKGGHLLPLADGHIYGVDHGVSFAAEDKLRTVLWQWRGKPLSRDAMNVLTRLERDLEQGRLGRAPRAPHPRRGRGHLVARAQAPQHRPAPLPPRTGPPFPGPRSENAPGGTCTLRACARLPSASIRAPRSPDPRRRA
ncbi:SCO1664 family protein [Streptosporangium lutulentum]